jgi:hypothetical protein
VLVRFVLLMLLALVPWTGMSSAAGSRVAFDEEPQVSDCGGDSKGQGPSLDDPNVDTDPERPITELASGFADEEEGEDQSDDYADGMCRSETLELWYQPDPTIFIQALAATRRAFG